jgi:ribosome-associated protein
MTELPDADRLAISAALSVPLRELHFRFSRSGGPGGQYVNRTETRVELLFDVAHSPSLSEGQRARLLGRLGGQLDREGVLHIVASARRSQLQNRGDAIARFQALLQSALRPHKRRVPTRPTPASHERRLASKHRRSEAKASRAEMDED